MRKPGHLLPAVLLPIAFSLMAACGPRQQGSSAAEAGRLPDHPPRRAVMCDQAEKASPYTEIGTEGGYLSVGRHLLSIPPGSVNGKPRFRIVQPKADYVVVRITPSGRPFTRSAYLVLSTAGCDVDESQLPLKVVRWNGQRWDDVAAATLTVIPREDQRNLEVTAEARLDSLSNYALASAN